MQTPERNKANDTENGYIHPRSIQNTPEDLMKESVIQKASRAKQRESN